LIHDIHEVVTGDLIPSFKSTEYKQKEDIASGVFMKALGFDSRRAKDFQYHIKIVDIVASLYEIKELRKRYPQTTRIYRQRLAKLKENNGIECVSYIRPFVEEIGALLRDEYDAFLGNYNKLVRDKIPEIIENSGDVAVTHTADDEEYWERVKAKLQEETDEFMRIEDPEELADILEVVYAICDVKGVDREDLEKIRKKKLAERGGFTKKVVLEETKS